MTDDTTPLNLATGSEEESTADLEAKLAAKKEREAEEKATKTEAPILEQIASSPHESFIDCLREVATNLKEAGKLGESEVVAAGEEGSVVGTLIKLVGELVDKHNK